MNYRFNRYIFLLLIFLSGLSGELAAQQQCTPRQELFKHGEQIHYDIYFKWGMLMPKAGQATFNMRNTQFRGQRTWQYQLSFRTSGFAEKVYKMRDTLESYFTPNMELLFSSKRTMEKNYYQIENITFTKQGNRTRTHTHRYNANRTKIDTTLYSQGCIFDMVGASMYLRSIDWSRLRVGDEFPIKVAIGKDIVNVSFRYNGQAIVERNENLKYRTRHFYVDIFDGAFEQSKEAAEVWIGDDENHVPVKVRAKLKIGAAEVYYNSSKNLKHPLTSRVVIPQR